MRIILAAVDAQLADAWERHCGSLESVTIHLGSILDLRVDAIVSPANSFGFMDGGIDRLTILVGMFRTDCKVSSRRLTMASC